ncbi:uncharacterized protein N0V89_005708 [Didymosphaeria variabile]|uniref:Uncharacterized protein n=1 Tax=Didymosphaeria variabile TaxID=1932322 RepID=A0A9W9CAQ8_9PLEO|nr:uncharacterized protein N0V89_005708 [Didymosphaeria variabile]KAJ4353976.1 hypothetical protein N0V89_005708 [Didymosphaeria variabile]
MSEATPFYLASIAHGHVLARSPNGQPSGVVAQNRGDQDAPQKWVAESADEENVIALRCLSNNEYLHANGGTNWSTVGTGEKQWWRLSNNNVTAPGACHLSPVDHPGVFLNHFQGIRVAKGQSMKVHMWQWEQPNEFCLTWYFVPADGSFGPQSGISGAVQEEDSKTDMAAKFKELEDKIARQAEKLEDQKAKLKQHTENRKEQKKEPTKALPPPQAKITVPATNGVTDKVKKDECKHVVLPPPRKIRRKVVGIVYAQ